MTSTSIQRDGLVCQVQAMIDEGRLGAARYLMNAILRLAPSSVETWEIEAQLLLREGATQQALDILDHALASNPRSTALRLCRVGARMQNRDNAGAALDAAEAVVANPRLLFAKALLGVLLWQLGRPNEALPCLLEAAAGDPGNAVYRQALASVQEVLGDIDSARRTLEDAIMRVPGHAGLRAALILLCIRHREFEAANLLAEAACECGITDASICTLMGHARSSLGRHAAADEAYAAAKRLSPEGPCGTYLQ